MIFLREAAGGGIEAPSFDAEPGEVPFDTTDWVEICQPLLAERLGFLIRHPETWPQMGRAGRKFVEERYDIHQLNRRLVELYEETRKSFEAADVPARGENMQ